MFNKIRPQGFFKKILTTQMNGLTGHIEAAGFPFDTPKWGEPDVFTRTDKPQWWIYEQAAYWIDGCLRTAILLDNVVWIEKIKAIIYKVFDQKDEDFYLGPKLLKETKGWSRWPHVVFFRACLALYEYNKDETIITHLTNHYLKSNIKNILFRDVLNIEIMILLYQINQHEELLEKAIKEYEEYNRLCENDLCDKVILSNKKPYAHAVSFNEFSKLGCLLYEATKDEKYLKVSIKAENTLDKKFMLLDGVCCSNEFLISNDVKESHETCLISDYTWFLYYLYQTTLETKYLDKIEKAIFNAGLGSVLPDFKALQYFSCVNQVILTSTSNHNAFYKGSEWMSYRPCPGTQCCAGNVNRFMPNYILHMYSQKDGFISVDLFGESNYETEYGKVEQITEYPYSNQLKFKIEVKKPFVLKIRKPLWCCGYHFDKKVQELPFTNGFIVLKMENNQEFSVVFEDEVKLQFHKNYGYVTKGVLLYALKVEESREIDLTTPAIVEGFNSYNMYPASDWNYGILKDQKVIFENGVVKVKVRKIKNWKLEHRRKIVRIKSLYSKTKVQMTGDFTFTKFLNNKTKLIIDDALEEIELIPYGKTNLRITAFPIVE